MSLVGVSILQGVQGGGQVGNGISAGAINTPNQNKSEVIHNRLVQLEAILANNRTLAWDLEARLIGCREAGSSDAKSDSSELPFLDAVIEALGILEAMAEQTRVTLLNLKNAI
jgi:hypothetical protein